MPFSSRWWLSVRAISTCWSRSRMDSAARSGTCQQSPLKSRHRPRHPKPSPERFIHWIAREPALPGSPPAIPSFAAAASCRSGLTLSTVQITENHLKRRNETRRVQMNGGHFLPRLPRVQWSLVLVPTGRLGHEDTHTAAGQDLSDQEARQRREGRRSGATSTLCSSGCRIDVIAEVAMPWVHGFVS